MATEGIKYKTVKPYDTSQRPDETLEKWYRRLAKTADQRLVRLSRYAEEANFEASTKVLFFAYSRAMVDIHKWSGAAAERFNTAPPASEERLIAKINDIRKFLEAPTSTKTGIENVYIKRANTLKEKYGMSFSWDQLAKYFDTSTAERWAKKFGSKTALKVIAQLQMNKDKLADAITKTDVENLQISDSQMKRNVEKALRDKRLHIKDLL